MEFKKVSKEQYFKDCGYYYAYGEDLKDADGFNLTEELNQEYDDIKLPTTATIYSAGSDFFLPFGVDLEPNETILIATGIRWVLTEDELKEYKSKNTGVYLSIVPKSGLGFKYKLRLNNTIGIIDSDYSFSDNEGHIMVKMTNEGDKPIHLDKGQGFVQGIVNPFIMMNNNEGNQRNGGFNSTAKNKEDMSK